MKAIVAVEHAMLIPAWSMLTGGEFYRDPGPDFYVGGHEKLPVGGHETAR